MNHCKNLECNSAYLHYSKFLVQPRQISKRTYHSFKYMSNHLKFLYRLTYVYINYKILHIKCHLFSMASINSYLCINDTTNLNVDHIVFDIALGGTLLACGPLPAAC